MRAKIVGAHHIPETGKALVVANHVSEQDGELLQQATKRKMVAVESSYVLKAGELVVFFPEGEPSRTGTMESFSRDLESLIKRNPDAVVVPACICAASAEHGSVLMFGPRFDGEVTAAAVRQHLTELSCEAIEQSKAPSSTLLHRLVRNARQRWRKPAIADSSKKALTYGGTLVGALLIGQWLKKGRRRDEQNIGVFLASSVGAALANYGITLAGKTAVNLNFTAGEQNCRAAIAQCELKTIITSRAFLQKTNLPQWPEMVLLEDIEQEFTRLNKLRAWLKGRFAPLKLLTRGVSPDATACILFSSGSTGIPKGVELTHWNVLTNADGASAMIPHGRGDCMLGVLPFFHSFGYTLALWFPLLAKFRAVYHGNPTDAKTVGDLAVRHRATIFLSTPTLCLQYARKCDPEQFATLQSVLVGAEKLRDSVFDEFQRHFGIALLAGYGCTELGPAVAVNTRDVTGAKAVHYGTRKGSVGRPFAGIAIRIADPETFTLLPAQQQGMVLVKGPSRMPGYYRALEQTAEVLRDGYYVTGDLGYMDEDGFLFITDRLARFSKICGEMAPHLRIEEVVADLTVSFVTGVPDEARGERLVMLYTNPEVTPAELMKKLNASGLPALWIPKRENIYGVAAIPALASGKIDLKRSRELAGCMMTGGREPVAFSKAVGGGVSVP